MATKINEYAEALKEARSGELKLRALLAMPINFGEQAPYLDPTSSPEPHPLAMDFEKIVAEALAGHKGYQSILREKEAKEIEVAYYKNQMLPSLQAKAVIGRGNKANDWNRSAKAFDGGDNYEIGLTVTVPLGNQTARAVWRKNTLEMERIEVRLSQKEDTIRKEISNALIAVEQAAVLVRAGKTNVRIKEKNLKASEKKAQFGTGNLRGLLDRQTDLVDAQLKLLQAQVDHQKALVEFYKARGRIDPALQIDIAAYPSPRP